MSQENISVDAFALTAVGEGNTGLISGSVEFCLGPRDKKILNE